MVRMAAAGLAATLIYPDAANAEAWRFVPTFLAATSYEDNRGLSANNPQEAWTTSVGGGLQLSRLTEITTVLGGVQYSYETTQGDDTSKDRGKLFFDGGVLHELSERQRVGVNASVIRDSTIGSLRVPSPVTVDDVGVAFEDLVEDEPPQAEGVPADETGAAAPEDQEDAATAEEGADVVETIDVDDGLVETDVERTRVTISPFWSYKLTERSSLRLQYGFNGLFFGDDQGTGLRESRTHSLSANVGYKLSRRDKLDFSTSFSLKKREDSADTRVYSVSAGYSRRLSEISNFGASLGVFETERAGDSSAGRTGTLYALDYSRRLIAGSFGARASRKLSPSGTGDLVASDLVQLNFSRNLKPRLSFALGGRYQRSESAEVDTTSVRTFVSVEPAVRWNISRWSTLRLSYRYRYKDDDRSGSADSNGVFVTLNYSKASNL